MLRPFLRPAVLLQLSIGLAVGGGVCWERAIWIAAFVCIALAIIIGFIALNQSAKTGDVV